MEDGLVWEARKILQVATSLNAAPPLCALATFLSLEDLLLEQNVLVILANTKVEDGEIAGATLKETGEVHALPVQHGRSGAIMGLALELVELPEKPGHDLVPREGQKMDTGGRLVQECPDKS